MDKKFEEILDDCLDRLGRGETVNDCLKHYPDYAEELRPYLITAQRLDQSFSPSRAAKEKGREKLSKAMSTEEKRKPSTIRNIFNRRFVWAPMAAVLALAIIASAIWGIFLPTQEPVYASTLEIRVTDIPPESGISSIEVTVSNIEVHKEGSRWGWRTRWTKVIGEEQTFDLIEIKDIEQILGEAGIEPGNYDRIRMRIESVKLVIDGGSLEADIPDRQLTLSQSFEVEEGEKIVVVLDFDVDQSIKRENGNVAFKPMVQMNIRKGQEDHGAHHGPPFSD